MALSALTQPHRRRETPGKAASLSSIYLIFFNTIGNVFSKLDAKTQFSAPLLLGPRRPPLDPDKRDAALLLVQSGMSPTKAAQQIGLGRSTLYRELQGQTHA